MSRNGYTRNYLHIQNKKEDKYEGLFSKKQLSDLDGGISDIKTTKIDTVQFQKNKIDQLIRGTSVNMADPYGFDVNK